MKYYIQNMIKNLSKEDTLFLKEIYEPKVVAIPPVDAGCNMCVTEEGEIRIYGSKGRKDWGDFGTGVYISSKDCGLSWKFHKYNDGKTLGAAGYNPQSGRYISVCPTPYRRDMTKNFEGDGSYIIINDEGYNSENNRYIKISDKTFEFLRQPEYLESCNRWIALTQYEHNAKTVPVVCISDDDGESWSVNIFKKCAPEYPQGPEDKGIRWQNQSCEPDFVELSDGTLIMIVRTSQNYHYMYTSSDHGTTWSEEPTPTIFNSTNTMPVLYKLDNGKILFFWCNTEMMPEIDQKNIDPPLSKNEIEGRAEDMFTNRDANHLAISEDDGKTWIGFREVFLNPARYCADFRRAGDDAPGDKSVHQGQIIELPYNKILIHFGQHEACARVVILDINWLYETERKEDFRFGLKNLSTQMYLESVIGGYRGFVGHCAYNRTHGATMTPDPDNNFDEALRIARVEDERLVYKKQGCVWNFPSSSEGEVTISLRVIKSGVRISLTDHWQNPFDETIKSKAYISFEITKDNAPDNIWTDITIKYNEEKADIFADKNLIKSIKINKKMPHGLSYLHIQTLAENEDFEGTCIKYLMKRTKQI